MITVFYESGRQIIDTKVTRFIVVSFLSSVIYILVYFTVFYAKCLVLLDF